MRTLILVLILAAAIACKKKKVDPAPEPADPAPPCTTKTKWFPGKFGNQTDTFEIVFVKNNCPAEESNTYIIKNFGNVMNAAMHQTIYATSDFTMTSNETERTGTGINTTIRFVDTPTQFYPLIYVRCTAVSSAFGEYQFGRPR